jgi:hypothetical protein
MIIKKRVPMPCVRFAALIFTFFFSDFQSIGSRSGRCVVRFVYTD